MKHEGEPRYRAHLISGGYPAGASAGHDMDYARLRLLEALYEDSRFSTTVSSDFSDLGRWLDGADLLVTYVAGPYPDEPQNDCLRDWLDSGGRWLALHGTSGGKAASIDGDRRRRAMVKTSHHETLGGFFLNHPPVRRFLVDVAESDHPLVRGLPQTFEVEDELYLVELQDPPATEILLTTELGVLDVVARISSDIVKVNYLRDNDRWTLSRLYFYFLWGEILLGTVILLIPNLGEPMLLLKTSAAMNGGVMFIYSIILLYMNRRILRGRLRMGLLQMIMVAWSILFFGFFTFQALQIDVLPYLQGLLGF